jgi:putative protease
MSPAGYWPQLGAAIEAGADACYFGLKHFTARAKVGFELSEIPQVMRTLHRRGVRGYLTFNTLVFEHEIEAAAAAIASLAEAGVDALIIQDIGILRLARHIAPDLELHASTQTSITNADGVRFALEQGAQRVTLARELSIAEIKTIHGQTGADLEIFVHGALCVAYSGQCFSSEAWGGRSANRGQCAQACRLPYELIVDRQHQPLGDARYLLSPGDLYGLHHIREIVDSGVSCLKIEGRYKDAEYVALTTRAYREAVDDVCAGRQHLVNSQRDIELQQVYSRGLGPYFLTGVNHQAVVQGRAPRHRGVRIGVVLQSTPTSILIEPDPAIELAPKPGDGIVFDAASWRSPEEPEEGGRIYSVVPSLDGAVSLQFANGAIRSDRIRPGDIVWRTHDPEIQRAAKPFFDPPAPLAKQPVHIDVYASEGEPLRLVWGLSSGLTITVDSPQPLGPAQNRELTREYLEAQLGRLGATPYRLEQLTLSISGHPFAPASLLNQLRREAVARLASHQSEPPQRTIFDPALHARTLPVRPRETESRLHLLVRTPEQLEAAIEFRPDSVTLDYLDLYGLRPSVERVRAAGLRVRVASPRILKPGESRITQFLISLDCQILVRSTGVLQQILAQPERRTLIGDFSLNTANSLTAEAFLGMPIDRLTPTHDLNARQIEQLAHRIGGAALEAIAYQHLPVFHTEHCVFCRFLSTGTTYRDCGRPCEKHTVAIRDPQGRAHPVMADVGCRNTVFGAEAQQAGNHLAIWREAGICDFRLEFVHESARETMAVSRLFRQALDGEFPFTELHGQLRRNAAQGVTEGSLYVPQSGVTLPILQ